MNNFMCSGQKACSYLLKKVVAEKDDFRKISLIQIIGVIKCNNSESKLTLFLKDPNWRVRIHTIDALVNLEYFQLIPKLKGVILSDIDDRVKIHAILAIGKNGRQSDLSFLNDLYSKENYHNPLLRKSIKIAIKSIENT